MAGRSHPEGVVCVGGATVDRIYRAQDALRSGTSNPVTSRRGFGGVARNVAESLARLGAKVDLISAVGDDGNGRAMTAHLAELGVNVGHVQVVPGFVTGTGARSQRSEQRVRSGRNRGRLPCKGRLGSERPERAAGDEVALKGERVVDRSMHRQKALG